MAKEALENKSNSMCVFIYLLYYSPYKTATAILLLCCNEDAHGLSSHCGFCTRWFKVYWLICVISCWESTLYQCLGMCLVTLKIFFPRRFLAWICNTMRGCKTEGCARQQETGLWKADSTRYRLWRLPCICLLLLL